MTSKRLLDLSLAVLGLIVLCPLLLVIALFITLDSPGPALFRQTRVGRRGRLFQILKFRTMVADAEQRGGQLTTSGDSRITRCGGALRKFKLDELPQLINVVRGEMSMVGPRPEVPRYVAMYTHVQSQVLELMPGITDPASIRYRDESAILAGYGNPEQAYVSTIMPEKIRLNLEYAATATAFTDLGIVFRTLFSIASR
jgi:lipopolysaccharide/colanic/teichoic acid biosynthesis glycosyltransferase